MTFDRLILSSDLTAVGQDRRRLSREVSAGRLVRVRHGAYAPMELWKDLDDWGRYGLRATALNSSTAARPLYCLQTAGLLWGLWIVGCPDSLHAVTAFKEGGRSAPGIRRHIGPLDTGVTTLFGFRVTDKARTAVELMARLPFAHAVAVADSSRQPKKTEPGTAQVGWKRDLPVGLPCSNEELEMAIRRLAGRARRHRARSVLAFSSDLAESPGESISRANMHILGLPPPELQHRFDLGAGKRARSDFYWPESALVGEFDGAGKYLRSDWGQGASIEDRVMEEKRREDRIRAHGMRFVRWEWTDAVDLNRLEKILTEAGLPQHLPGTGSARAGSRPSIVDAQSPDPPSTGKR